MITLIYVDSTGAEFIQHWDNLPALSIWQVIEQSDFVHHHDFAYLQAWAEEVGDSQPNAKAWYVGIFSQKKALNTIVTEGARIEIYRPLALDAMKNRTHKVKADQKHAARLRSVPRLNRRF